MSITRARCTRPVHPHVRGDGFFVAVVGVSSAGSPPRAWGRQRRGDMDSGRRRFTPTCVGTAIIAVGHGRAFRFTPTCVGTARLYPAARGPSSVHPHVRGDGGDMGSLQIRHCGSPPRAWGRRPAGPRAGATARFTPTCVGTAPPPPPYTPARSVHPHVRGDGVEPAAVQIASVGSPPRAWGRPMPGIGIIPHSRFTPTCVGTADIISSQSPTVTVHPHVRGDGDVVGFSLRLRAGSPPRAWGRRSPFLCLLDQGRFTPTCVGTALGDQDLDTGYRFTPTCVGTAVRLGFKRRRHTVHPHVRGDGPITASDFDNDTGSPPRAWGRRVKLLLPLAEMRFTPTCVGTAPRRHAERRLPSVHPHVRGDGIRGMMFRVRRDGSPPRAWGRRTRSMLTRRS